MKWRWDHLRNALARRIRYKITRGGLLFTFAVLVVGLGAVMSANNLLFLILAAMFATLLVSDLVSRLVLAGLELELLLPEHISARCKTRAVVRLRNWKRWMPSFSIRLAGTGKEQTLTHALYFPVVPGGRTVETGVDLEFPRRGAHTENLFAFTTRFRLLINSNVGNVTTYTLTAAQALTPGHSFSWYIGANNSSGVTWSSATAFTLATSQISPTAGSTIAASNGYNAPTFTWASLVGAAAPAGFAAMSRVSL